MVEAITEGSKQLKTALEEGKKIIITTVQKFPYIVNEIGGIALEINLLLLLMKHTAAKVEILLES